MGSKTTWLRTGLAVGVALLAACESKGKPGGEDSLDVSVEPFEGGLHRLTTSQYQNVLRDVFGQELVLPTRIEPDVTVEGLVAVGAARSSISPRGVEQYEDAARQVAAQVAQPGGVRTALHLGAAGRYREHY